jgi:hypothetical protein
LNRRRQPFQAYYQRIPLVLQQLNFAEWPQFCDHSVTSADVRLSVGPKLSWYQAKSSRYQSRCGSKYVKPAKPSQCVDVLVKPFSNPASKTRFLFAV